MYWVISFSLLLILALFVTPFAYSLDCSDLPSSKYTCDEPSIDSETGEYKKCPEDGKLSITCKVEDGVNCDGETTFQKSIECRYTNGKKFSTALLLSAILGVFGADRFYLGYPTLGLIKLFTGGFFIFGNIIDMCMIAMQRLKPSDGSNYIVGVSGPRISRTKEDSQTYQPTKSYL
ncbi:beta-amyloid binding protein-related [Anaeramoeba flamelloides]|uniref:Beta-amyloid binding protein-related n=1 Tax=Anaeramoeba flamelloides TaxID=1746091 RepID=A0AAV7Y5S7_9EUKA|nr:beta-amyloid binding protein-related [Anaeramoeba flamelloides]